MSFLADSFISALHLIWSLNREMISIVSVSLRVSLGSVIIASFLGVPLGLAISLKTFVGKRFVITCLNTLLALPTVAIGLFVYVFISRRGVFGIFDLLYSQNAIIIGQTILVLPLISSLTISTVSQIDDRYRKTALTLGANGRQAATMIFLEARFGILAAVVAAFGRVVSEVGISMMLGGNAKGFTRTITTAMALEYDKGEFVLALALGFVLLILSFVVNTLFHFFQGRGKR